MSREVNVDPAEIDKFQAIASRWWDLESEFKPLHEINPVSWPKPWRKGVRA